MNKIAEKITVDPDVCHGKPTIRGSRLTVSTILELLAAGMTYDELLFDYEGLHLDDIYACLEYANLMSSFKTVHLKPTTA
jgi:uncharacterized protein (DUF433 family)